MPCGGWPRPCAHPWTPWPSPQAPAYPLGPPPQGRDQKQQWRYQEQGLLHQQQHQSVQAAGEARQEGPRGRAAVAAQRATVRRAARA